MRSDGTRLLILCAVLAGEARAAAVFSGGELPARVEQGDPRGLFDLIVNTEPKGTFLIVLRGDDALIAVDDLSTAGLQGFSGERITVEGRELVSLKSLAPSVKYTLDEAALAVRLDADPELLGHVVIDLRAAPRPKDIELHGDNSAFFNYSAQADTRGAVSAFTEAGASIRGSLLYSGLSRLPDGTLVRGLSSLTVDQPDDLRRWVAGDAVHTGSALGGGATVFGLTVQREYSLNPYYLRSPLPATRGFATTPSTLEVYVNGQMVRREQIAPGSYDLLNLPLNSGAGGYQTVLRDSFGRVTEVSNSFYDAINVLAKGLQEYSYSFGMQRSRFATDSFSYGTPTFLGNHRFGVTDHFTAGGRLELTPGLTSGGLEATAGLPIGELSLQLAASAGSHQRGVAATFSWLYTRRSLSIGALGVARTDAYANVSLAPSEDRALLQGMLFASYRVTGRFGLSIEGQMTRNRDAGDQARAALRADYAVAQNGAVTASIGQGTAGMDASIGFTWSFGNLTSASGGVTGTRAGAGANAQVQRSIGDRAGFGYRVLASQDPQGGTAGTAEVTAQGSAGRLDASVDHAGGQSVASVSGSGGAILIGGDLFFSRAVQNGYALVQVPELPGVRGMLNNQVVGTTDAHGNLLLPNLIPYYGNKISIEPVDLPLDREVGAVEKFVATPLRGGAVVRFEAPKLSFLTGELVIEEQGATKVPAFGELTVKTPRGEKVSPIGRTGGFALEGIDAGRYPAQIATENGTCDMVLEITQAGGQVDLGKVLCKQQTRVAGAP